MAQNRRSIFALRFAGMMLLMWNLQVSASTITWNAAGGPAPAGSGNWSTAHSWNNGTSDCTSSAQCQNASFLGSPAANVIVDASHNPNAAGTSNDNISSLTFASLSIGTNFTVTSNGGAALTISGTTTNNGTLNWSGQLTLSGNTANTNGVLTGAGIITNNATITGGAINASGTFTNTAGTISGSSIGAGTTITGGTVTGSVSNLGTLSGVTNTGTVTGGTVTGTTTNTAGTLASVTNTGTINGGALSGSISNTGATISGTTINAGATVSSGTAIGTITNGGTLSGMTIGTIANSATVNGGTISGTTDATNGTLNNVLFNGASLTNGTITGGSSATGINTLAGTVTNTGTLSILSGTTTVLSGATLVTDAGVVDVNGGTLNIAAGGTVDLALGFREDAGVVTLSGTLDVSIANLLGGTIDGTGDLDATTLTNGTTGANGVNLDVAGSAAAWGGTATIGTDEFGTYNQSGGGTLSLNFNGADTSNDAVLASAGVNLAGTLDLLDVNGAQLNLANLLTNQSYVLINDAGGAVSGTFSTINETGTLHTGSGAPGAAAGWWLVYNGADVASGHGDVELDFVTAVGTPEPGTDILLGCALVGFAVLRRKLVKR